MHFQLKNSAIWRWTGLAAVLIVTNLCAVSGQAPDPQPETFAGPPPPALLPDEKMNPEILLWPNGAPGSEGKTEGVGHGFGIQARNSPAVAGWIDRFYEWLFTQGLL